MLSNDLHQLMKSEGIKITPQRLAIAEVLVNSTDHPSVQQIYERVKDHFPSLTLNTIYSTINVLVKRGLIQELPFQQYSRYESNLNPHLNLVCTICGDIADSSAADALVKDLLLNVEGSENFEIAWQRMDFYGECKKCTSVKD
ncbi:MAG: transcriptional repressor [SAR202 cluster bacterium]|nr:transcriptional repressor [Chloroflexota bacterium]MQG36043.1 transcriptional repressor [SAR202 cluster bacterium]MQG87019.1 transcriptional repressor [SAR202 cluster bacterium]|tara:strand:+ start:14797 stop:15225 length:429 start_codon:yes stop_codon:yes gene_type:complete